MESCRFIRSVSDDFKTTLFCGFKPINGCVQLKPGEDSIVINVRSTRFLTSFSAGEQRGVEVQLDPIRLTALVVGLLRFEQEVRAEGKRMIFSGSNHRK